MRIQSVELFKFSELTWTAKENAINNYLNSNAGFDDSDYYDFIYDDYSTIAALFGLDINTKAVKLMNGKIRYDPNIYFDTDRNRFLSFDGRYSYKAGSVKALKDYAPIDSELMRIVKRLQDIQRKNFYSIVGNFSHGRNRLACSFYRNDEKQLSEDYENELIELFDDFAYCILKAIESEIEYRYSREYAIESIEANDYEFLENGELS